VSGDEQQRLAALHEYRMLDAPADDELAAVVRVAAMVAGVPTATLNLIDEHRQCQLTTTGFAGGDSARGDSMCAGHFASGEFVHVRDAAADPTFRNNPWVTGVYADVRFYASAPLVTPQGHALGTLCVFDSEPHELGAAQIARLKDLAGVILALFERRRQARINRELATEAEARQQELQLAHAELLRSNAELEQFAAVVSHDLAAPLGVVNGYLELVGEHYAGELGEQGQKWITSGMCAVGRMQALIDSLLRYARAGSGPCRRERTGLADLVDQALMDLRDQLREGGTTVRVTGPAAVLTGDPTLLRQLLQNLLGNAVKYRHPDRACDVEVCARRDGAGWLISVRDNGIGIPDDQCRRVFEMFTRVQPASPLGHGVGLSTCERIVTRHGGRIWIDATPGGGTTVSFTLPDA
jgi:signal transduction histidine kinase